MLHKFAECCVVKLPLHILSTEPNLREKIWVREWMMLYTGFAHQEKDGMKCAMSTHTGSQGPPVSSFKIL